MRRKTAYVITNRKIIRKQGANVDTLEKDAIMNTDIKFYDDGCGTIILNNTAYYGRRRYGSYPKPFILDNIPNVADTQRALASME